jgi:hypothetical protein
MDDEGRTLRLHNALVALGKAGFMVREFAGLPPEEKERILGELQTAAVGESDRATWARRAFEYLTHQEEQKAKSGSRPQSDPYGIIPTLAKAARSPDELTRKYTVVALGNWREAGSDALLQELAGENADLTRFVDGDEHRARRELRQTAALALARRGSPRTPWHVVLEALDEETLRNKNYPNKEAMATDVLVKAIHDLHELRNTQPDVLEKQTDVKAALERLAESPTPVVQVEARKLLGGTGPGGKPSFGISREFLLVGTLGVTILFFLTLAVVARWRRKPPVHEHTA